MVAEANEVYSLLVETYIIEMCHEYSCNYNVYSVFQNIYVSFWPKNWLFQIYLKNYCDFFNFYYNSPYSFNDFIKSCDESNWDAVINGSKVLHSRLYDGDDLKGDIPFEELEKREDVHIMYFEKEYPEEITTEAMRRANIEFKQYMIDYRSRIALILENPAYQQTYFDVIDGKMKNSELHNYPSSGLTEELAEKVKIESEEIMFNIYFGYIRDPDYFTPEQILQFEKANNIVGRSGEEGIELVVRKQKDRELRAIYEGYVRSNLEQVIREYNIKYNIKEPTSTSYKSIFLNFWKEVKKKLGW